MSWPEILAGEIMLKRGGSVNPAKFPDEIFDLFSIPAFDRGEYDVLAGQEIGSSKAVIAPNDVLISKIIPHIRRCQVVPKRKSNRQIGSGEWIIFRSPKHDPNFLRHFLVSDSFHRQFMNTVAGMGGSLVRARPSAVAEIKIPLPPLDEQKRIAGILDRAEGLRRKRARACALANTLLRSVFLDMFGDPTQVSDNIFTLNDVSKISRGRFSPRPRNDPRYYGGEHPFIQTGDIANSNGYLVTHKQTLNHLGTKVSKAFPKGSVLVAIVGATIGATSITSKEYWCPDSVIGIVSNQNDYPAEFLEFLLRFWKPIFVDKAPSTARANINLETLRPVPIPNSTQEDRMKFSAFYKRIYETILNMEKVDNTLFQSLTQRAFMGELTG